MKRYAIVEVTEQNGPWSNLPFKSEPYWTFKRLDILTGPVELMHEACKVARVAYRFPRKGEGFFRKAIDGKIIGIADHDFDSLRFVIPADPEPCPNCQNAKGIHLIESSRKINGEWICYRCNRPESEWTYAKDIEWAGIGSGIM